MAHLSIADPIAELIDDIISPMTLEVAQLYTDMMALESMLVKLRVEVELRLVMPVDTVFVFVVVRVSVETVFVAVGVSVATEVVMVVVWVAELPSYMVMVEMAGMAKTAC